MGAEKNYLGSDTRIVSPVVVPTHQKFPNMPLFIAIAGVLSLLGGAAVAWVSSLFGGPTDGENLGGELGTSFLGLIRLPHSGSIAGTGKAHRFRRAAFWEQIRTLRSMLESSYKSVILGTAQAPNDGKSIVAACLARAISASGTRTLLFDADVRRPLAYKLLGIEVGKSDRQEGWKSSVQPSRKAIVPVPGAPDICLFSPWLLGADVDALGGTRLDTMLDVLRSEFKVIIIVAAPIGSVADALQAVGLADGMIVVARSGAAKKLIACLSRMIAGLEQHGAQVRGFVLTSSGNPASLVYQYPGNALANDCLVDIVSIPKRRSSAPRAVDAAVKSLPEAA